MALNPRLSSVHLLQLGIPNTQGSSSLTKIFPSSFCIPTPIHSSSLFLKQAVIAILTFLQSIGRPLLSLEISTNSDPSAAISDISHWDCRLWELKRPDVETEVPGDEVPVSEWLIPGLLTRDCAPCQCTQVKVSCWTSSREGHGGRDLPTASSVKVQSLSK